VDLCKVFNIYLNSVQKYVADFARDELEGLITHCSGLRERSIAGVAGDQFYPDLCMPDYRIFRPGLVHRYQIVDMVLLNT
jgi:hypothetical protein